MAIFADDFESDDWTAWTGGATAAGCSRDTVNTDKHHGTYAAYCTMGGGGADQATFYKTFASAQATLYGRVYIKLKTSDNPSNSKYMTVLAFYGSNFMAQVRLYKNSSGTKKIRLVYRSGSSTINNDVNFTFVVDVWYCIELYAKIDNAAGEFKVWRDGVQTHNISGVDNNEYGNVARMYCGCQYSTWDVANEMYTDCCVADTSYIGLESSGMQLFTLHNEMGY